VSRCLTLSLAFDQICLNACILAIMCHCRPLLTVSLCQHTSDVTYSLAYLGCQLDCAYRMGLKLSRRLLADAIIPSAPRWGWVQPWSCQLAFTCVHLGCVCLSADQHLMPSLSWLKLRLGAPVLGASLLRQLVPLWGCDSCCILCGKGLLNRYSHTLCVKQHGMHVCQQFLRMFASSQSAWFSAAGAHAWHVSSRAEQY